MTQAELRALYRTLADDAVQPYQVSDAQVNLWITEAEREAAERGLYLRTGAAHNISVLSGTASYSLSSSVIHVDSLKLSTANEPLQQTTRLELDCTVYGWADKTGTPLLWLLEGATITLYPKPDANFTLQVFGSRRPESSMETPAYLHESLVHWILYRAYSIRDADINAKEEAARNLGLFGLAFGHKRTASFDNAWRCGSKVSLTTSPF